MEPGVAAEDEFEPRGLSRDLPHLGHEIQATGDVGYFGMAVWREGVPALGDAPHPSNGRGDLCPREHTALSGLRPLGELDLKHAHLPVLSNGSELGFVEAPLGRAHAILGRAYLKHDVRAAFEVQRGKAPFPRVHPAASLGGAEAQGTDGDIGKGAVAHTGHVEEALGFIGLAAPGPKGEGWGFLAFLIEAGEGGVEKANRTRRGGDFRAAEGHRVIEVLCRPVDPASLRAVEGHFLSVHGEKVLPKEDAKMFELIAGPPQHGVVPK